MGFTASGNLGQNHKLLDEAVQRQNNYARRKHFLHTVYSANFLQLDLDEALSSMKKRLPTPRRLDAMSKVFGNKDLVTIMCKML